MQNVHPLTEYAKRSGRTFTEIAKESGCSRMTLYRLVKGEQNATLGLLRRISEACDGEVPVSAFTEAEQPNDPHQYRPSRQEWLDAD